MLRIRQPKALLFSVGLYLTFFAVSVNPPQQHAQASELHEEAKLHVYLLGGLTHIGLGLEVLDEAGRPMGMRVWDFGSRNHYSYKDEEWITGKRNWLGSLTNLSLLGGATEGEMRAWDPTLRFDMELEEFKRSAYVKVRLPVTQAQWERMNLWLHEQTLTFNQHHQYDGLGLDIWFGGGVSYDLFTYNCATFIGQALFVGEILTRDNVPRSLEQTQPIPSRWLVPPSLLNHYASEPLLSAQMIQRKVEAAYRQRQCLFQAPGALSALWGNVCRLS